MADEYEVRRGQLKAKNGLWGYDLDQFSCPENGDATQLRKNGSWYMHPHLLGG